MSTRPAAVKRYFEDGGNVAECRARKGMPRPARPVAPFFPGVTPVTRPGPGVPILPRIKGRLCPRAQGQGSDGHEEFQEQATHDISAAGGDRRRAADCLRDADLSAHQSLEATAKASTSLPDQASALKPFDDQLAALTAFAAREDLAVAQYWTTVRDAHFMNLIALDVETDRRNTLGRFIDDRLRELAGRPDVDPDLVRARQSAINLAGPRRPRRGHTSRALPGKRTGGPTARSLLPGGDGRSGFGGFCTPSRRCPPANHLPLDWTCLRELEAL